MVPSDEKTPKKSPSAIYQARFRDRMRQKGYVKREIWIPPARIGELKRIESKLRDGGMVQQSERTRTGEMIERPIWNTHSLYQALCDSDPVQQGRIRLELIAGTEPGILAEMIDFGDLPLVMSVSGDQILVDVTLWPVSAVTDQAAFNALLLKTHKLLPLSSFGIGGGPDGEPVYELFGALASGSLLSNVLLEMETLADNALQVAETFRDYLAKSAA